jgi:hypothetical protein
MATIPTVVLTLKVHLLRDGNVQCPFSALKGADLRKAKEMLARDHFHFAAMVAAETGAKATYKYAATSSTITITSPVKKLLSAALLELTSMFTDAAADTWMEHNIHVVAEYEIGLDLTHINVKVPLRKPKFVASALQMTKRAAPKRATRRT